MTPRPPACAMAMASADSVTVSIAAETRGIPSSIARVSRVRVLVSVGRTEEAAGVSSTSSNVNACRISMLPPQVKVAAHYTHGYRQGKNLGAGLICERGARRQLSTITLEMKVYRWLTPDRRWPT